MMGGLLTLYPLFLAGMWVVPYSKEILQCWYLFADSESILMTPTFHFMETRQWDSPSRADCLNCVFTFECSVYNTLIVVTLSAHARCLWSLIMRFHFSNKT